MKLLYLYVETWPERGITKKNPIEVNFDCGYKFRYDREINKLSCKRGQDLPKGFFSLSAEEGCVDSVSVIIGDNGSRKTTIAATFGRLFQQERHLPEYICIYKQGARLIIYYHFEDGTMPLYSSIEGTWINAEDDTEYAKVAIHNRPFDILYYSPYFTNNEIWSGEVMADKVDNVNLPLHDISTTYLMSHPKTSDKDIDRINAFRFEEQERILRFAHEYVNTFGKLKREAGKSVTKNDEHGPVLPPPIYAQFIVDTSTVVQFMESPLAGRIPEVRDVVCNQDCHNPVWQLVSKILVCILRAQIDDKHSEQVYRYKRILIEICGKIQEAAQQTANKDRFQEFSDYVKRISGVEALKAVLRPMVKVYGNSVLRRPREGYVLWGQVDIADKDDFDDVIDVKRHMPRLESWLARAIGRHETLMNVELANMSSGEMAYWTLFARLYDVFRNKMPKNDRRDILLFLDEAETTLHPVWQQQLVRNVIWFLEKFVNEKTRGDATMRRVHVIFATHSPMILSDIPMGNVAFLIKDRKDLTGRVIQSETEMRKLLGEMNDTFGANIFDLYRQPFFLSENGGRLSTEKLKDLVKKIHRILLDKKSVILSEEDWWVLDHVGDPQVQKYFDSVKPLVENAMNGTGRHETT